MTKKQKKVLRCFAAAFAASFLLGTSIALMHPAQWLMNNRKIQWFSTVDGILFWVSLICLVVCQIIGRNAAKKCRDVTEKQATKQIKFFKTKEALISTAAFLIGAVGTTICLIISSYSTIQTFLLAGIMVFGFANFLNFRSQSYRMIRLFWSRKSLKREKNGGKHV